MTRRIEKWASSALVLLAYVVPSGLLPGCQVDEPAPSETPWTFSDGSKARGMDTEAPRDGGVQMDASEGGEEFGDIRTDFKDAPGTVEPEVGCGPELHPGRCYRKPGRVVAKYPATDGVCRQESVSRLKDWELINEFRYEYDECGRRIRRVVDGGLVDGPPDGRPEIEKEWRYGELGKPIRRRTYENGEASPNIEYKYKYSEEGRLATRWTRVRDEEHWTMRDEYHYSDCGRRERAVLWKDGDGFGYGQNPIRAGETEFEYDDRGRLILERIRYLQIGPGRLDIHRWSYDDRGRVSETTVRWIKPDEPDWTRREVFKYGPAGKRRLKMVYSKRGSESWTLMGKATYFYDEYGRLREVRRGQIDHWPVYFETFYYNCEEK